MALAEDAPGVVVESFGHCCGGRAVALGASVTAQSESGLGNGSEGNSEGALGVVVEIVC